MRKLEEGRNKEERERKRKKENARDSGKGVRIVVPTERMIQKLSGQTAKH